jgi:hypothetical protein
MTCQSLNRRLRKHCTDLNYACHRVTWIKSLKSRELTPEMELLRVFDDKEDCIKAVCLGRNKSTKNLTFKYIKE